jgi:hypothetical protein
MVGCGGSLLLPGSAVKMFRESGPPLNKLLWSELHCSLHLSTSGHPLVFYPIYVDELAYL